MKADIIHHYPPEILNLLVDTIPLLCRSKKSVLIFFKGAGVPTSFTADYQQKISDNRDSVSKYEIVREVLVRLNDKGEASLRERREIIKRVVEWEDYSTCWPDDQLKAKGLVAEIRRVVEVKDSFGRMQQEQEIERKKRQDEEANKTAVLKERRATRTQVKNDLFALFGLTDPQKRGKQLEEVLNRLFQIEGILVREAFVRTGEKREGIVEQIDGVIELDGGIYLVEMKWWEKPLGTGEVSPHLVRVFSRHGARGLLISYSGWKGTGPQEIDVALFEPSERFWGDSWLLPARENLLLALKKDTTGSAAYQLVNQVNSWLVISGSAQEKMDSTNPDKVVEAFALNYLEDYAAGPEAQRMIKLSAPLTIDSVSGVGGTFEMQNGTILQQALATVKNFRVNDEKTIALLEKFMSAPGSPAKGGAFSALIKIDPVLSWNEGFALYEANSLDSYTFSKVIPVVITPEYLSQIDPAQIQKLLESNPGLARDIARAFWQMSDHRTKDPRAIPWLGECLSNPDVEVQYFGMMGLYEVCGKKEHFPTAFIALFKTDPQKYLAAYQAWWAEHRGEYVLNSK